MMLPLKTKANRLIPNQESHTDSFRCISLHARTQNKNIRVTTTVMSLRDYSKIPRNFELNTDGTC